ncbi:DUF2306 domain-containing protein [Flavihumibacter sp. R14]|nr:DUF2306 domain-containing protein [Flavihumibacter soli]
MVKKSLWVLFALLAISVGLYPAIYFLIDREFGLLNSKDDQLLRNVFWNAGFYTHIILGGIALLVGWSQFIARLRTTRLSLHRTIGKIYVVAALLSALAGIYIGFFATGGLITSAGFISLGCIWFTTTFLAYTSIKKGDTTRHEIMMIFSYAACFAAVTLRIWLPLLIMVFQDFTPAYRIVAWLCWVPNLLVAFFIVRRIQRSKHVSAIDTPSLEMK